METNRKSIWYQAKSRRNPSFRPYGQKLLLVDAGADEDAAVDSRGEEAQGDRDDGGLREAVRETLGEPLEGQLTPLLNQIV